MKLFGNRRRAAHAAPRQKLPRGTRAAIIAVCVVLALTGGVFAAWKMIVKHVRRPGKHTDRSPRQQLKNHRHRRAYNSRDPHPVELHAISLRFREALNFMSV